MDLHSAGRWSCHIQERVLPEVSKLHHAVKNKSKDIKSSVKRQKGESQNGCSGKQSTPNFPKNEHFLPLDTHVRFRGLRNVRSSENLACFVFLKHPFWNSPFCLITDEIQFSLEKRLEKRKWIHSLLSTHHSSRWIVL